MNTFGKTASVVRNFQNANNISQLWKCTSSKVYRSTVAATAEEELDTSEWAKARPFEEIPGPKPLPIPMVGNVWRFFSFGTYGKMDLVQQQQHFYETYGSIVRLTGLPRNDLVFLFDPKDVERMFRNETIWPIRNGLQSFQYYRDVIRKDIFDGYTGVVTSQGKAWHDFRTKINQPMMQPRNAKLYIKPIDNVADEFIARMKSLRDKKLEMPKNFSNELNKWALESIAVIALDTRLGCLDGELDPESEPQKMIQAVHDMFDSFYQLDVLPSAWTIISTPTYRKHIRTLDLLTNVALKHVKAAMERMKSSKESLENRVPSILETLLIREENPKFAVTMALDMLIAGVDTTSNTVATALYFLAVNPEKQEKLAEEIKAMTPDKNQPLTAEILNELKYLKAVIKESQRMAPITVGNQRAAGKDLVIGNYRIPKGTDLLSSNLLMCRMEKHFKNANEFTPERWLKTSIGSDISSKNTNPFVFLPFGFGPRTCVGRRFAELEVQVLLTKIIQNFKVAYNYGKMEWMSKTLYTPCKPLQYEMKDRV